MQIEIVCGRIYCSAVRDMVSRLQFEGYNISMWESSGWISREIIIKGDERAIKIVSAMVTKFTREREGRAAS